MSLDDKLKGQIESLLAYGLLLGKYDGEEYDAKFEEAVTTSLSAIKRAILEELPEEKKYGEYAGEGFNQAIKEMKSKLEEK